MNAAEFMAVVQAKGSKPWQLVKHIDEVPEKRLKFPAWAEVKYDGVFCAVVLLPTIEVLYLSRTGKELYSGVGGRLDAWKYMHEPGVYICELICTDGSLSLEELSGLVNPNRVQPWEGIGPNTLGLVAHDYLTLEQYCTGEKVPQAERGSALDRNWCGERAVGCTVNSEEEFEDFADKLIAFGGEGAVLKQLDAPYIPGHKGHHTVKRVRGLHLDLACVGYEMGRAGTKREGLVAKLVLRYKGHQFSADLGAGWTDELRKDLTQRLEEWRVGDSLEPFGIFHVKALQESSTGTALRLPKVLEQRMDKREADA